MNNLKAVREESGLTRRVVSYLTSIPTRTLARYESGETLPDIYTAYRLSRCFRKPFQEVFPDES